MPDPLPAPGLAAFVAAVDAGTIQGAADDLDLTQSAATKRIQALERRAGATLLERGPGGVRPTPAGRRLYPEARRALDALRDAEAAVWAVADVPVLRLSASHTIGELLLPGWVAAFRAAQREPVQAQVAVVNSPAVLRAVREGDAHVGFVEGLDALPPAVRALVVARDEIACVVAAGHPWAGRRAIGARDLASGEGGPYVTRERGSGTRAVAAAALAAVGIELEPALETASIESVKRALAGGGFTLISGLSVEAEERAGVLRCLPVRGVDLRRELRAVSRRRPAPPPTARRFWRWLEAHSESI